MTSAKPATEININTTEPDGTFKSDFKPVCQLTKSDVLEFCKQLGFDADALALHWFDNELDNLLEWQAKSIYWALRVYRNDNKPKGETHFATCFSCSRDFVCFCSDPDHEHGECSACHEGIGLRPIPQYDWKQEGQTRQAEIGAGRKRKFINYD